MNHKKFLAASFLAFFSLAAFAKTKTTVKNTVSIDFRLNTKSDDGKNHLNWTTSSTKIKDKYDAVSGASVSHSTGELFSVIHGTNPKTLLAPKGLRSLLLFAVSSPDFLRKDELQITKQDDGKIKITFTHRNVNYLILSDEKGKIDIDKNFFINQNGIQNSTQEQIADSKQINTDEKDGHGLDKENLSQDSRPLKNQDDKNQPADSTQMNTDEKDGHGLDKENLSQDSRPLKNQDDKNQPADSTQMNTDEKDGHGLDEENLPQDSSSQQNQDDKNQPADSTQMNTDEKDGHRLDEENLPEGFEADIATEKSKYSGKLKLTLKNDVLTIKGKIRLFEITEIPDDE